LDKRNLLNVGRRHFVDLSDNLGVENEVEGAAGLAATSKGAALVGTGLPTRACNS
jgi:hypothetical protein